MTKVLFGGSFNPPTVAHLEIIDYLSKHFDQVIVLPNGDEYSFLNKKLNSYDHRINMLKCMLKHYNNVSISEMERNQTFKGTYLTLELLNHPYFVLGADCLTTIDRWINVEKLIRDNHFIVFNRDEINVDKLINEHPLLSKFQSHFHIVDVKIKNISSTDFKIKYLNNENVDEMVTKDVLEYIKSNRLYK